MESSTRIRKLGRTIALVAGAICCLAMAGVGVAMAIDGSSFSATTESEEATMELKAVLPDEGAELSETDLQDAAQTIDGFVAARNNTYTVPAENIAVVADELTKVAESSESALQSIDDARPAILPADVRSAKQAAWEDAVWRFCSEEYARALVAEDPIAWLDLSLYNNPKDAPYVEIQSTVLSVMQAGMSDGQNVLWVLCWNAPFRAGSSEPDVECWSVWEYLLTQDEENWRINSAAPLLACHDSNKDLWGARTAHEPIGQGEWSGRCSVLYPHDRPPYEGMEKLDL